MASILRTGCKALGLLAAPLVLSTAVKACLQDQRVAQVASGTIMFLSGIACMTKAVIRRADGGSKIGAVALGTLGLGMSAAGFAQASMGINEILYPPPKLPDCKERINQIQLEILQCPATKEVWDSVHREGPIPIKCTKDVSEVAGVVWELTKRIIYVSKDVKEDLRSKFVNAIVSLSVYKHKLYFLGKACTLPVAEFVREMEGMEWRAIRRAYELGKKCVETGSWASSQLIYRENFESPHHEDNWRTFKRYFAKMNELGHTKEYEEMWHRNCQEKEL